VVGEGVVVVVVVVVVIAAGLAKGGNNVHEESATEYVTLSMYIEKRPRGFPAGSLTASNSTVNSELDVMGTCAPMYQSSLLLVADAFHTSTLPMLFFTYTWRENLSSLSQPKENVKQPGTFPVGQPRLLHMTPLSALSTRPG
jgi:hypothetical protein